MERFQEARDAAKKRLLSADHMISLTYPLVKENRMLITITENIFLALTSTLAALLYYERTFKRIPPFYDTFDSKFHMFSEEVSRSYKLNPDYTKLLMEVRELLLAHRESRIEFSRNENFIIYADNYKSMKKINIDKMKEYLTLARQFFKDVAVI